jgi:hypothetical protein
MTEKPSGKAPAAPNSGTEAGHLGTDDLGNVTWEWQDQGDLLADDTLGGAERLRALVDPSPQQSEGPEIGLQPVQQWRPRQAVLEEEEGLARAVEMDRAAQEAV